MTLSSQSPRSGMSTRYMASRKKRPGKGVLLAGLGVVVIGVVVFLLIRGGGDDAAVAEPDASLASANEPAPNTPPPSSPRVAHSAENLPDPRRERSASDEPSPSATQAEQSVTPRQINPAPEPETREPETTVAVQRRQNGAPAQASRLRGNDAERMSLGLQLIREGQFVQARRVLSDLLFNPAMALPRDQERALRDQLTQLNEALIRTGDAQPDDDTLALYTVQSGDNLGAIARRYRLTHEFAAEINGLSNPNAIRVGQTLRLITGPMHARVIKSEYIMDVYFFDPAGRPIYYTSFPVGLGTDNGTPVGTWRIEAGRKTHEPGWRDDQTGRWYPPDDPENPIGDYWLALEGTDGNTRNLSGYGIHGTIEPDSIGQNMSRGCIRLADGDIEQVFYMLVETHSTVQIMP